ncbi:MAG: hypothetical protein M1819_002626 [Sarea resinae]|nr:MAG: hypothetical protein M1819_002626 [Sarea resinae]
MASSQAFNPFNQTFTLLLPDETPINVTMQDLNAYVNYGIEICIDYSAQFGASLVLLVVLLLLTKSEKRRSIIFAVNVLSLALNTIRSLLQCFYFTGPFYQPYAYFSQDFSRVPHSEYATMVASIVLTFLLLVSLEMSLVFQTRVVCVTLRDIHRRCITLVSGQIALCAIGFRFALMVENAIYIMNAEDFESFAWLASASNITTSISICFFCAVFVIKLGFAMSQRRKLGLRQFGPMQVIFIMGCQTLIIPSIFSILEYFTSVPELGSNSLTLVAIFLPLSSMWASASIHDRTQQFASPQGNGKLLSSSNTNSASSSSAGSSPKSLVHPNGRRSYLQSPNVRTDCEGLGPDMEAQGTDIRVEHKLSVTSTLA